MVSTTPRSSLACGRTDRGISYPLNSGRLWAYRSHTCDCSGADWTRPSRGAIAFDFAAQSNWFIPGIGFDVFGAAFPSNHSYGAVAVMPQLGWFGE